MKIGKKSKTQNMKIVFLFILGKTQWEDYDDFIDAIRARRTIWYFQLNQHKSYIKKKCKKYLYERYYDGVVWHKILAVQHINYATVYRSFRSIGLFYFLMLSHFLLYFIEHVSAFTSLHITEREGLNLLRRIFYLLSFYVFSCCRW